MVPTPELLQSASIDAYVDAIATARDAVTRRLATVDSPWTGVDARGLRGAVAAVDLDRPLAGFDETVDELGRLYLDDAVWFHHPRYVAHLNPPVAVAAVAAEVLATAVNSSLDTWDQSAGATLIEQALVRWTADRLGLGPAADGVFTSGGTQSNLHALYTAREHAPPVDVARYVVVTSADAHFSVDTSAKLLGLARDAVVRVGTDADHRVDPAAVDRCLSDLRSRGRVPLAVVATAGTTDFGAIDPLGELAVIAARHGVWCHVDAAYGGGLITSDRHRGRLAGIGRADSVTVDFHKTFFQPVAASVLLVREATTLRSATWNADYLNPADHDVASRPNLVDKSLQTTRRFDALKLWCTLRTIGPDRIGEMLDALVVLAARGFDLLRDDPELHAPVRPQLTTLVFRYAPEGLEPGLVDEVNAAARRALAAAGEATVASTRVDGRVFLKLTLLNPDCTLDDIRFVLERVRAHARAHVSTLRAAA